MTKLHICDLNCAGCGMPLEGLESDRVFTCVDCMLAMEIRDGKKVRWPLRLAPASEGTSLPVFYLPFWRMPVQIVFRGPDGQDAFPGSAAANIDSVWVSAFFEVRPSYHGNPGRDLTYREAVMLCEEVPPPDIAVLGGARTSEQANRYAYVYVADILDKSKDITGFQLDVTPGAPEYWAVPFGYDASDFTLLDLTGGKRYGAAVVEGFPAFLLK